MDRIVIPPFETASKWTKMFCRSVQWMTAPTYLADDLFQECYFVWQKIMHEYVSKPERERLMLYKGACRNRVCDIATALRSRKAGSIETINSTELLHHDTLDESALLLQDFFDFVQASLNPKREPNFTFDQFRAAINESLSGIRSRRTKNVIQDYVTRLGSHRITEFLTGVSANV